MMKKSIGMLGILSEDKMSKQIKGIKHHNGDQRYRTFIIKGEEIGAVDKLTAKRIYNRKHKIKY